MNCRSINNKVDVFASLVATTQAKIIMGTESWLDSAIPDTEVFPHGFTAYRKDRNRHGGGVFILVANEWTSEEVSFHNSAEAVWCRVFLPKGNTVVFGCFYRPPDSGDTPMTLLSEMVQLIPDSVLLSGDFNLPDFDWITSGTQNRSSVYTLFGEFLRVFGFCQYVNVPTRHDAILDLILCNDPNIVSTVSVIPGISDHKAIVADLKIEYCQVAQAIPRQIFLYEQGDYDSVSAELESYYPTFLLLAESRCSLALWSYFR